MKTRMEKLWSASVMMGLGGSCVGMYFSSLVLAFGIAVIGLGFVIALDGATTPTK